MRRRRGLFVVLEGLDGAGTTTQAGRLGDWLRARGRQVHLTAEPSKGPVGTQIRHVLSGRLRGGSGGDFDPGALALLFAADRLDHWSGEIQPRLEAGVDVVSDRYVLSSLAYQAVATGDAEWVRALNARAPAPVLTVFLRVRPAVALARRYAATAEREIFEVPAFQRRVHRAYGAALAGIVADGQRVAELDGERGPDDVARAVAAAVGTLLR
ncbi:MAG TPA: dTMP kinase [Anaeromyxobacteraceae bacterium]|nr:dTMP kinase [Anaeromyxobacteraceae bacterium]